MDIPRHCSCIYFVLNQVSLIVRKSDPERLGPVGGTGPFVRFKFTVTVGSEEPEKASLTKLFPLTFVILSVHILKFQFYIPYPRPH